jgi:hypothetical protein
MLDDVDTICLQCYITTWVGYSCTNKKCGLTFDTEVGTIPIVDSLETGSNNAKDVLYQCPDCGGTMYCNNQDPTHRTVDALIWLKLENITSHTEVGDANAHSAQQGAIH